MIFLSFCRIREIRLVKAYSSDFMDGKEKEISRNFDEDGVNLMHFVNLVK